MRSLQYNEYGGTDKLQWVEVALPNIRPHEALVQVKAAGINPTDTKIRNGEMKFLSIFTGSFPRTMGLDFAGVVTAVGDEVTGLKIGDQVFGGTGLSGGSFADFVKADADKLTIIPEGLGFAEASSITLNGGTAIATVNHYVEPTENLKVLVNGASGGVGLFIMQILIAKGCMVTATAGTESIEKLKAMGAYEVIDYKAVNVLTAGKLYDVIVDASGHMKFEDAQAILEENGSFCTLTPDAKSIGTQVGNLFRSKKEKNVLAQASKEDMADLLNLISSGKVKCVIGKTFPLADAIKVQQDLESGKIKITGKAVLVTD